MKSEEDINKENELLLEEIKKAAKDLSKYFDSVQIFCNKHECADIGTSKFSYGCGNFWARYGQVINWIKEEDENKD